MRDINNINVNLKKRIDEFPEDIRDIAMEIVKDFNNQNKSKQSIEEMINRKINNLLSEGN